MTYRTGPAFEPGNRPHVEQILRKISPLWQIHVYLLFGIQILTRSTLSPWPWLVYDNYPVKSTRYTILSSTVDKIICCHVDKMIANNIVMVTKKIRLIVTRFGSQWPRSVGSSTMWSILLHLLFRPLLMKGNHLNCLLSFFWLHPYTWSRFTTVTGHGSHTYIHTNIYNLVVMAMSKMLIRY
jgi:hypothetical protein